MIELLGPLGVGDRLVRTSVFRLVQEGWLTASREGLHLLTRSEDGTWRTRKIGDGAPGEIKVGQANGRRMLATIEPWHGTSVVVYREPDAGAASAALWPRVTHRRSETGCCLS